MLKMMSIYITEKSEKEAIDQRQQQVADGPTIVKPQKIVDICVTCVSPNPPKLPL